MQCTFFSSRECLGMITQNTVDANYFLVLWCPVQMQAMLTKFLCEESRWNFVIGKFISDGTNGTTTFLPVDIRPRPDRQNSKKSGASISSR